MKTWKDTDVRTFRKPNTSKTWLILWMFLNNISFNFVHILPSNTFLFKIVCTYDFSFQSTLQLLFNVSIVQYNFSSFSFCQLWQSFVSACVVGCLSWLWQTLRCCANLLSPAYFGIKTCHKCWWKNVSSSWWQPKCPFFIQWKF